MTQVEIKKRLTQLKEQAMKEGRLIISLQKNAYRLDGQITLLEEMLTETVEKPPSIGE